MKEQTKIFLVSPSPSTFTERDLEALRREYLVREAVISNYRGGNGLKRSLLITFEILRGVLWADLTYSWFAHNHSYLAVTLANLLGKRTIVVIGGYEVAREPEIGYGALLNQKLAKRVNYIIQNADHILAVSEFNRREILELGDHRHVAVVYNGIDCAQFSPGEEKDDLVITVCQISQSNIALKGLDTFLETARHFPDLRFAVIGRDLDGSIEDLRRDAPPNVEIISPTSQGELLQWYRRAKVYCQLSYRESFGVALAEAMACECVPVVTDRGALPEVVGDTGFVVPYGDAEATAAGILGALQSDRGKAARARVEKEFSLEGRMQKIRNIIEERPV
ncbi:MULTISPECIES: glycosyltransferase family 4 protein [Methanoculleus]|uniref:Glycosyl transferase, group 1 n=2 Tax=Methanoculleus TaxID=45989 RepID=A3CVY2_METMJ|nr:MULTISPECIES: glycosyltransferase family 4 protein [Methanoculleus]ABN57532.1 glycosyl transferase, group 1 [Methanoculleus marisnigri JR1]MCC7554880.1 glycosyltransferase family 4 protein [Methanoculleus marisnigri]UYU18935.1 glycosyltransferase family 4 protein [Methanoculleus submarinus]